MGFAATRDVADPVASDRIEPDLPDGWAEGSRTADSVVYADGEERLLTIDVSYVQGSPAEHVDAVGARDELLAEYFQQYTFELELEAIASWQLGSQLAYTFGRDTETVGREIWAVGDVERTEAVVTVETGLRGDNPTMAAGDNDERLRAAVAGIEH